jgi:hypothetical protein
MSLKNDYVLVSVKRGYLPESNVHYLICIYTNGLEEIDLEIIYGDEIKTILKYERLD